MLKQTQSLGANSCKVIRNKQLYLDKILWCIQFICVVITKPLLLVYIYYSGGDGGVVLVAVVVG